MKVIKLPGAIVAALIMLGGCAAYQLSSESKKITIENISADTFTVGFCATAYMKQEDVEKYALSRASEEALAKGCPQFFVVKKRDESEFCEYNPQKNLGSTSMTPLKDYPVSGVSPFMKPNITLTLQCVRNGGKVKGKVIDAKKFLEENPIGYK
ncbi:MAG: hypothetical protein PHP17_01960 [Candidatus Omnitrophica bacterium]|nr:hypothetical protein [Candidatus Omnitrophota bacterium]